MSSGEGQATAMAKRHEIKHVTDMLNLSEEEFLRMLPDLCLWWCAAKSINDVEGVENTGFVWVDDGVVGVDHYEAINPETGKRAVHPFKDTP